nr:RES domain-containing protein [uncultured Rhodopila sp.]
MPALHTSRRLETAWLEAQQGFPFKALPMPLCAYEIDCEALLDLTGPGILAAHAITPGDLACRWKDLATRGTRPPTWQLAERLVANAAPESENTPPLPPANDETPSPLPDSIGTSMRDAPANEKPEAETGAHS